MRSLTLVVCGAQRYSHDFDSSLGQKPTFQVKDYLFVDRQSDSAVVPEASVELMALLRAICSVDHLDLTSCSIVIQSL